ncbi:prepilin-type N-terminal cleavage/methylation domain-containing protein [Pseudoalteromonas sp. J010]|uniref:PulJ/GspJ family protein n=1 Tax=Pseudoalteromonas sp. J010 TaxID=998465 RepID=UPI001639ADC6|nr:prepilin-type N-terminal cleavage/methylation domain-containing protein [Pseudoalteromonas sp. J010]
MAGKQRGFTLVELLIAITLLSLVMVTGTFAYFQLASRWDKELGDFQQQAQTAKVVTQLEQVLKGIIPYVVRDKEGKPTFFFVGSESRLLAVTNNGLISGKPEVFRLVLQQQESHFQLVYQAIAMEKVILTSTEQSLDFSSTKVLLNRLQGADFNYYGWQSLTLKSNRIPGTKPSWFNNYRSQERGLTPEYIKLKIDDFTLFSQLDREPSHWKGHFSEGGML